jgi:hypothetical protein
MIIIDNSKLQSHIMYALSDSHMHKILQSTSFSVKSVTDIIREQDLPHSSAYKKIADCGVIVAAGAATLVIP